MALTATVTPGKTFVAAELVTNSKLNQLAAPSVSIAGTADTTQISDDSVTAAKGAFGPWFYGVDTGSAIAHVVAIAGHTLAAYVDGLIVRYRVGTGNDSVTILAGVGLTSSGTTATVTATHALTVGDKVMVYGATPDDYNGTFRVASVTGTASFTYVFAGSATTTATGTINVRYSAVGGEGSFIQTSGVTVDVAGLGAKNLFGPAGTRLMPGEIVSGEIIEILYNGTSDWFEILSRETASEVIRAVDNSPTANAYAAQATDGRTTLLVNNTLLVCRMALANTASATLTFGSISGTIRKNGLTALTSGDIVGGQWCQFIWDGTYWQMLSPAVPASARATVPVRQTVLACSVGSTGLPNYVAVSGQNISFQNCDTTNLVIAFAAGYDISGAVDYVGVVSANTSNVWTISVTNATYYLYAERNTSTGAISYGSVTTLAPAYTNSSAISTATDQHTFSINTMKMSVGIAGPSSTVVQRVFLGECVVSGGVLQTPTIYMPRGEFQSGTDDTFTLAQGTETQTHQLGLTPRVVRWVLVNVISQHGYDPGAECDAVAVRGPSYEVSTDVSATTTTVAIRYRWGVIAPQVLNASSALGAVTAINWTLRAYAYRGW